jgi:acyl carrier protein
MKAAEIQTSVRKFLTSNYVTGQAGTNLKNGDDLLHLLNSLQILRTVMELETMFGIKVDNSELAPENLGTIDNIVAFVLRKLS